MTMIRVIFKTYKEPRWRHWILRPPGPEDWEWGRTLCGHRISVSSQKKKQRWQQSLPICPKCAAFAEGKTFTYTMNPPDGWEQAKLESVPA